MPLVICEVKEKKLYRVNDKLRKINLRRKVALNEGRVILYYLIFPKFSCNPE